MHYRLGTISLAATTLLFSVPSPLLSLGHFEPLSAQAQTTQDRKTESDRLSHPYDWALFILMGNGL